MLQKCATSKNASLSHASEEPRMIHLNEHHLITKLTAPFVLLCLFDFCFNFKAVFVDRF